MSDEKSGQPSIYNLHGLLEQLRMHTGHGQQVSVGMMMDAVGTRSFGPLLMFAGAIPASPLSGVPGVSTLSAIFVLIVVVQLLMGRRHFWLPRWLLKRRISKPRFQQALAFLQKPAAFIDRLIKPRLTALTTGPSVYVIALICMLVAVLMPPMEVLPLTNSLSGAALTLFGLALTVHDGYLVLLGLILCASIFFVAASLYSS